MKYKTGYPPSRPLLFFKYKETTTTSAIYRRYQHPGKREGMKEVGVGKVKLECEIRWVEQHTTLEEFGEMYEVILDCLTAISNNEGNK